MEIESELIPKFDSRKSFYKKAKVRTTGVGEITLRSYNTDVAKFKNGKPEVYGTYSATTLRHLKEFLRQGGIKADSKREIMRYYKRR